MNSRRIEVVTGFVALSVCCFAFNVGFAQEVWVDGPEADDYGDYQDDYGADDGLPMVYAGQGMRFTIEQVDPSGFVKGTMVLGENRPMQFQMRMDPNGQSGTGQVQTANGARPFQAYDESMEITVVEFDGRRYRLSYQDHDKRRSDYGTGSPDDYGNAPNTGYGQERYDSDRGSNNKPPVSTGGDQTRKTKPKPTARGTVVLQQHRLGGTHTVLAPKGWKVEGGVWQPPSQAFNWLPSRNIVITAPDGTTVHFRPNIQAMDHRPAMQAPPQPGSLNAQRGIIHLPMPGSLEQWSQWVQNENIRGVFQQASSVRAEPARIEPELTEKLRRLHAPMTQFLASQASTANIQMDTVALSVRSTFSANGAQWQQLDAFNNLYAGAHMPTVFGPTEYANFWDIKDAVTLRAPKGTLDAQMPVLLTVVNSLRQTPEWTRQLVDLKMKLSKINHQMAMQSIETYGKISREMYRANQEVNASIMSSYEKQNQARDASHRDFINYIRDMDDYRDPSTNSTVTLPSTYDRVYSNGSGQYLLTSDPKFSPGSGWSQIQAAR